MTLLHVFEGQTADEAWRKIVPAFRVGSDAAHQEGRDGTTRELLRAIISIAEPRQRWVAGRSPPLNPAFAIAETLWMLWGRNDEALPVFFSNSYSRFNGPGPFYGGAYGMRLRRASGVDQLERAAETLSSNPNSRQVVLQIWSAAEDLPLADGNPRRGDVPCNLFSMLKVRDGRLHWTQVLRSNDLILGVPYNFVQFTTLQEVLAGWLGLELGAYIHIADSLHVYERDFEKLSKLTSVNVERNLDMLGLPIAESRIVLADLEQRVEDLIRQSLAPAELETAASPNGLPAGYGNLLAIMAAESARRRGWFDLSLSCAATCTNPALTQLWHAWMNRVTSTNLPVVR